ncbi:putative SOS response-associated peptidase YoqW [Capsulimonas corticalis]|uniref:Abasic site processing protein n=1 Tax=Capsulimonas corticalis TaxID=2219043 RepID=A0A9N7QDI7_9BACT|nr:SOS response-associated peptidase family protein [Capsulimonas corticalis]BDI33350.1 putative SOS response-associated peptidase YoqW [Capsulimonas corticalis]
MDTDTDRTIVKNIATIFQARLTKSAVDSALLGGAGAPMLTVFAYKGERWVGAFDWGLIAWGRSEEGQLHSRAETLRANAGNRPLTIRRCVIPMPFFHQRITVDGLGAGTVGKRARVERGDGIFIAAAGIWDEWKSPDGQEVRRTCAIVTTTPNDTMAQIHDRMPVILPAQAWDMWLNPEERSPKAVLSLLQPWSGAPLLITLAEKSKAAPKPPSPQTGDLFGSL